MRHLDEIIVHCTATKPDWAPMWPTSAKVNEVRRWHVEERRWSDIGYHFLIDRNGTIEEGRPLARAGAHTKGHNSTTIGIALFGGFGAAADDPPAEHFTLAQLVSLRQLIGDLNEDYGPLAVHGHNEYAAKACPGFNVPEWYGGHDEH